MTGIERELAEFATGTRWDQVAVEAQQRARLLLLDSLACAFTGRRAASRETFAATARGLGDGIDHLVIDDAQPAGLAAATLLNAWQTTATTMCDVYRPAMCHVTPFVLAAELAHLDAAASTSELLLAIALGAEVTVRLCNAMDGSLYQGARWHAPGVIGPFGAATAAAVLQGLDAETLESAWGLALLQASGTFAAIGSAGVKFTQARAALAGVQSVALTVAGHGGALGAFTHPDGGLFAAYGGGTPAAARHRLGDEWALLDISLRRWPAASSLQSVIEAVLALRADDVGLDRLEVALPPQSFKLCADKGWGNQLTALQSARWVAAVVGTDGDCWLDQFSPERLGDPAVADAALKIVVVEDASLPGGAARVSTRSGARAVLVAPGSPARPLSTADVEAKLGRAAGTERARDLIAALDDDDLGAFKAGLRPQG